MNYKGFLIFTWKSFISNKLFCGGDGDGIFYYLRTDFLGVFLTDGDGGGGGGGGTGSSKSGYLISLMAVFITMF